MWLRCASALVFLVVLGAGGCGRTKRAMNDADLRDGVGGTSGAGGVGAGRSPGTGARSGTPSGSAGVASPAGANGAAGVGVAGAGIPGTAGPGSGAAGTGNGRPIPPTAGVSGAGFGGAGFSGAGFSGAGFSGAGIGTAGSPSAQTCQWSGGGFCVFPDGAQCNGFTCCALSGNRCCDGTGRCGATIPPPPAWVPPIDADDIGTPGWKKSKAPLCSGPGDFAYGSVWSDSRGVFVTSNVYSQTQDEMNDPDGTCIGCPYMVIDHNDGTGWRRVEGAHTFGTQRLKGFDAGPLILYGSAQNPMDMNRGCGLALLDDGKLTCEPVDGVSDVTVVGTTAYAALQGDLVRYDGTTWGPVPVVFPGQHELFALWGDADVLMGTGSTAGKVFALRNNVWNVEDTHTLETFSTIFGSSATDVWAGTLQEHLFHYDGTEWKQVSWPGSGCSQLSGITGMWGMDGVMYFTTASSLSRWNGTKVEVIAEWECAFNSSTAIAGIWGNSPTELFMLMVDYNETRQPCGTQFLFYYDGTQFHRM